MVCTELTPAVIRALAALSKPPWVELPPNSISFQRDGVVVTVIPDVGIISKNQEQILSNCGRNQLESLFNDPDSVSHSVLPDSKPQLDSAIDNVESQLNNIRADFKALKAYRAKLKSELSSLKKQLQSANSTRSLKKRVDFNLAAEKSLKLDSQSKETVPSEKENSPVTQEERSSSEEELKSPDKESPPIAEKHASAELEMAVSAEAEDGVLLEQTDKATTTAEDPDEALKHAENEIARLAAEAQELEEKAEEEEMEALAIAEKEKKKEKERALLEERKRRAIQERERARRATEEARTLRANVEKERARLADRARRFTLNGRHSERDRSDTGRGKPRRAGQEKERLVQQRERNRKAEEEEIARMNKEAKELERKLAKDTDSESTDHDENESNISGRNIDKRKESVPMTPKEKKTAYEKKLEMEAARKKENEAKIAAKLKAAQEKKMEAARKKAEEEKLAAKLKAAQEAARIKAEEEKRLAVEAKKEEALRAEVARKRAEEEKRAAERIAEQERLAAERKAEQERLAAELKAEEERLAAKLKAEEERQAAELKAEEDRLAAELEAEEKRIAAERLKAKEEKFAAERKAEEERRLEAARKKLEEEKLKAKREAEEQRRLEAARKKEQEEKLAAERAVEEERKREAARKKAEEEKLAAERAAEEERKREVNRKKVEQKKREAALKAAKEKKLAAARKKAQEEKLAVELKAAQEKRLAAELKAAQEKKIAAARKKAQEEEKRMAAEQKAAAEKAEREKAAIDKRLSAARQELEKKRLEAGRSASESQLPDDAFYRQLTDEEERRERFPRNNSVLRRGGGKIEVGRMSFERGKERTKNGRRNKLDYDEKRNSLVLEEVSSPESIEYPTNSNSNDDDEWRIGSVGDNIQYLLPGSTHKLVNRIGGNKEELSSLIVTPSGRDIIYSKKNGYVHCNNNTVKEMLRSTKSYPITLCVGSFDRYYIKFANGVEKWSAQADLDIDISVGDVSRVSFGTHPDSYVVQYHNGSLRWCNISNELEEVLCSDDFADEIAFVSLGPTGEYFVRDVENALAYASENKLTRDFLNGIEAERLQGEVTFGKDGATIVRCN